MSSSRAAQRRPPNIVLIITDDQGYGDLGCHGNKVLRTPNIDRLHAESVRFTNFHADPLCAPTRSALLTGRYCYRTGVTAAYAGRSILRRDETTMANIFAGNGYRTGVFGKWHLGDNYPYRPNDRGFDESIVCWSGGVNQAADYWGNDYFDDTYYHNNRPRKFSGYCTDVFAAQAAAYIEANKDRPFFLYLAANAPHAPYFVDEKYSRPYIDQGASPTMAAFYGMIANLDENVGRMRSKLGELGLDANTIFIFMTDNGTAAGYGPRVGEGRWSGFNAGMRGTKGSPFEGGHRVPFFIRWPAGGLAGGRDIPRLAAHIDVLPTLIDLAGLKHANIAFDGVSLAPLLRSKSGFPGDRVHFIQHQQFRVDGKLQLEEPKPWLNSAVLTERWRLIEGAELYDLSADPGQTRNVAAANPEVVKRLRAAYGKWWPDVTRRFGEYLEIAVGTEHANPARLSCFDWYGGDGPPNQPKIKEAPLGNGFWAIEVTRAGAYQITLRQQPPEADFPIEGTAARLKIGAQENSKPIPQGAAAVTFEMKLPAGKTKMETWFTMADGRSRGAYFAYVRYMT